METLIYHIFIQNWPRKLVAITIAIFLWLFVNHSISDTKTIPSVPIRIVNLPDDKTILGLLPNGVLSKRIALTLTGSRDVIREIEPGDLEVLIDASSIDRDEWVLKINKKNLVSLNPSLNLSRNIREVTHNEYIIHMSRLVSEQIPIKILPPTGEAPPGYEYLGIWPLQLTQTVTGSEEILTQLKNKGLELVFDLNEITKADLDAIESSHLNNEDDEISFLVPIHWKEVLIPLQPNVKEEVNDPEAQNLRIDFLRKELLAVGKSLPIRVFYPLKHADTTNPQNTRLAISDEIQEKNGIYIFNRPLFAYETSRLFLDIVIDNLEIVVLADPSHEKKDLLWSLEIIDPQELEDIYVAYMKESVNDKTVNAAKLKSLEAMLRKRFKEYMHKLILYTSPKEKLNLRAWIEGEEIKVRS